MMSLASAVAFPATVCRMSSRTVNSPRRVSASWARFSMIGRIMFSTSRLSWRWYSSGDDEATILRSGFRIVIHPAAMDRKLNRLD